MLWFYWSCDHCCYVVGGGMRLYYLIILCLFFHKDTQLCKPWRDFLNQMIKIGVGKDLLGHFSLTLASDCAASNKQDEASAPSFGRLASTIQLIHTANTFSLTFNSQLTALFFLIQFSKKKISLYFLIVFNF